MRPFKVIAAVLILAALVTFLTMDHTKMTMGLLIVGVLAQLADDWIQRKA